MNMLRGLLFPAPSTILNTRYADNGESLMKYLGSALRLWLVHHANEDEDGSFTVRSTTGLLAGMELCISVSPSGNVPTP